MFVPVMSAGMRSGVNCTRPVSTPSTRLRVRTSSVFATPGTPSISACWCVRRVISASSTADSCPMTAGGTHDRWRDHVPLSQDGGARPRNLGIRGVAADDHDDPDTAGRRERGHADLGPELELAPGHLYEP